MLNVTVVQEVAPGISFSNPGSTIFRALPVDNVLNITPLTCTNSSSGSVSIHPVIVSPWVVHWSNVDPTATEDFPTAVSEHHVTRDEQFNTTVKACLPECLTGLDFYVIIPTDSGEPVVTVDDAYVMFVGSDILNATLFPGDGNFLLLLCACCTFIYLLQLFSNCLLAVHSSEYIRQHYRPVFWNSCEVFLWFRGSSAI